MVEARPSQPTYHHHSINCTCAHVCTCVKSFHAARFSAAADMPLATRLVVVELAFATRICHPTSVLRGCLGNNGSGKHRQLPLWTMIGIVRTQHTSPLTELQHHMVPKSVDLRKRRVCLSHVVHGLLCCRWMLTSQENNSQCELQNTAQKTHLRTCANAHIHV